MEVPSGASKVVIPFTQQPLSSPLVAYINATPTSGYAPLTVSFAGSASGGTPPYYYNWQFIGFTLPGQYVNQTFTEATDYPITLMVSDSASGFAEANITIHVEAVPFTIDPTASPNNGLTPLAVTFNANPTGGAVPYSWNWYIANSDYPITTESFSHTFTTAGFFPVQLEAFASGSQQRASGWANVTVDSSVPLSANLSVSPLLGVAPLTVTASGSGANADPPYSYSWTFGDGTNAVGATITHTYDQPGSYDIVLTVTDSEGHTATSSEMVRAIEVLKGTAMATPANASSGTVISFSGTASGGVPPYAYTWSFGDGTGSTGQNVSHSYSVAGNYTVVFCVNDSAREMACGGHTLVISASAGALTLIPGLSATEGFLLIGALAAVVVIVGVILTVRRRRAAPVGPPAQAEAPGEGEPPTAP
jgi:PKD repeat protein